MSAYRCLLKGHFQIKLPQLPYIKRGIGAGYLYLGLHMHARPSDISQKLVINDLLRKPDYHSLSNLIMMLGTSVLFLALAATGFAQAPEGYSTVYITSKVDTKFVIVAKERVAGSTTIVYVLGSLATLTLLS